MSAISARSDLAAAEFLLAWMSDDGPRAIVQIGHDFDLVFSSSADAQAAASACAEACWQLRELEAAAAVTS